MNNLLFYLAFVIFISVNALQRDVTGVFHWQSVVPLLGTVDVFPDHCQSDSFCNEWTNWQKRGCKFCSFYASWKCDVVPIHSLVILFLFYLYFACIFSKELGHLHVCAVDGVSFRSHTSMPLQWIIVCWNSVYDPWSDDCGDCFVNINRCVLKKRPNCLTDVVFVICHKLL